MDAYIKSIIKVNTLAIVIFSITMIVKEIHVFNMTFDLRWLGIIFLVSMWSYSIGLYYKNSKTSNK